MGNGASCDSFEPEAKISKKDNIQKVLNFEIWLNFEAVPG